MTVIEATYHLSSHDWSAEAELARVERERDLFFLIVLVTTWRYLRLLEDVARLCETLDDERQRGIWLEDRLAALMVRDGD